MPGLIGFRMGDRHLHLATGSRQSCSAVVDHRTADHYHQSLADHHRQHILAVAVELAAAGVAGYAAVGYVAADHTVVEQAGVLVVPGEPEYYH